MSEVPIYHPAYNATQPSETNARFWLEAIAYASDDAIVGKYLNGIVISWNKGAEGLFGFTSNEMVGQPITSIIPPNRIPEEAWILDRITRGDKIVDFETERRDKNGALLSVSLTVLAVRDDQNMMVGAVHTIRDLRRRNSSENKLTQSEAALAVSRAETKFGVSELLTAVTALAASRAEAKVGVADLLVSETALASSKAKAKIRVAELLTAVTALAASRAEAKVGVADLLISETALASSKAETKIGVAELLVAVTALAASRAEAKVGVADLLISETALASSKAETKIGVADLLVAVTALAASRAEAKVGVADLLKSETALASSKAETKIGVADLLVAVTALAASRAETKVGMADLALVGALNDHLSQHLTEARDRAEQANRAKSRFLAGMSHELRTPLNAIMGSAHLLRMEGDLNYTQAVRVDAMLASGKHLVEMIACVLDLSEIEAEHVTLRAVDVDPKAIATACLDLIRPAAEAKVLALNLLVPSDMLGNVSLDPRRLRQILLNLLSNAVKYTSQGGITMGLTTSEVRSVLRIEVVDTGPGIPASQRQHLFQDFERLDFETSSEEGSGLGLAISSRLANLMGGRLGHDDNPSGGSIFWLELPLNTTAMSLPGAEPALKPQEDFAQAKQSLHVLVVDDVEMNREIAGSFLRAGGHRVTCAEGGPEAVAAAADIDFDCILMDVRMPEMDGLEATRQIRALEGMRGQVPIVALTAQAFSDQIAACCEAGMDSHLSKPFDPESLLAIVVTAVSSGHSRVKVSSGSPTR